jgi:alkylation response protein AidB-like acyl-CoA dehydrogenase
LEQSAHGLRLQGAKIFASGVDHVARPIVTATDAEGRQHLVLVRLETAHVRVDLDAWRAQGMRASVSGRIDLGGTPITEADLLGPPGAYHAQPDFSAGAWRFAAVQLGGLEELAQAARDHLLKIHRDEDPHQRHRLGLMAGAAETARLWVQKAAGIAEDGEADAERIVAYVNLARLAVERAALDVLELAHRAVGAAAFLEPHPVERLARDLAFYLRQPAPDQALTSAAAFVFGRDRVIGDLWP